MMENKRLTYKDNKGNYQLDNDYVVEKGIDENGLDDITDYVGELEDLEEQIGCPLDVVFKAMTSQIYYDIASGTGTIVQPFLVVNDDGMFVFDTMGEESSDIFLNDYKQTWWLKEDRSE